ncbi:MAG: HD domain-containing protein [Chlamydiota bacterium]
MFNRLCLLFFVGCTPFVLDALPVEEKSAHVQVVEAESWLDKFAKSDKDVLEQFRSFKQSLQKGVEKGLLSEADVGKILQAVSFAAEKHKSQFRKNANKTPYVIHPIGVANHIVSIGNVYEVDVVIAALLHDVMDGTDATYEEIATYFGLKVVEYIQEVTGELTLSDKEQKKQQIIEAPHQSREVAIIKLADKLHNISTLIKDPSQGWSQDSLDGYFQWVHAVVDHLPDVNDPLKEAVHKTIAGYWESQGDRVE